MHLFALETSQNLEKYFFALCNFLLWFFLRFENNPFPCQRNSLIRSQKLELRNNCALQYTQERWLIRRLLHTSLFIYCNLAEMNPVDMKHAACWFHLHLLFLSWYFQQDFLWHMLRHNCRCCRPFSCQGTCSWTDVTVVFSFSLDTNRAPRWTSVSAKLRWLKTPLHLTDVVYLEMKAFKLGVTWFYYPHNLLLSQIQSWRKHLRDANPHKNYTSLCTKQQLMNVTYRQRSPALECDTIRSYRQALSWYNVWTASSFSFD